MVNPIMAVMNHTSFTSMLTIWKYSKLSIRKGLTALVGLLHLIPSDDVKDRC